MSRAVEMMVVVLGLLVLLAGALWLGLRTEPAPYPPYEQGAPALETVALPEGLPSPVARYYRTIIGDQIPLVRSAVVSGRARLRLFGLRFPARFRFVYIAGRAYRHDIEVTFFGRPLMRVHEVYREGEARLELPVGVIEGEPKVNAAANLGLWGESIWLPSILVTDPRVRWEALDDTSARLVVPFGDEEDVFTATFDPQSGLLVSLEAMRWKEPESEVKLRWSNAPLGWRAFHGVLIPSPASTTWQDERSPWAVWTIEEVAYNVDVSDYFTTRGE